MWNSRYTLMSLLGFALLVRSATLVAAPGALRADPDGYRRLAENLVQHGTFGFQDQPTAFRPPLYPLALGVCVATGPWSRLAMGLLHVAFGAATVWLVFRMVDRSASRGPVRIFVSTESVLTSKGTVPFSLTRKSGQSPSRAAAIWAGVLTVCDPILLWQSTLVMTETMAAFCAVLAVAALVAAAERPAWHRAVGAGMCLGLAILCRPTFLPFAAMVGLVAIARRGSPAPAETADRQVSSESARGSTKGVARPGDKPPRDERPPCWSARLAVLGFGLVGLGVVLLPWVVRNQVQFGRPIVATTHGGYTLLLGNNPYFYEYLRSGPWGVAWEVNDLERARRLDAAGRAPLGELEADRLAYEEARQSIRREPGMFVYACLVRVGRLWSLLPHQIPGEESASRRGLRYAVGLWYLLELPLAAFGTLVWLRDRRQAGWLWWVLLAVGFTMVHTVYWTDMRMRAPLMPGVAMAAVAGIMALAARSRPQGSPRQELPGGSDGERSPPQGDCTITYRSFQCVGNGS